MLKITKEKIARKAGCQSPSMNGQFMTTQPRLDDSGDKVVPCGVFTKSKSHKDTQLLHRLSPDAQLGPTLSVRVFEFERMCGLDTFNSQPKREQTHSVDHRLLGPSAFSTIKKVSTVLQKKT